MREITAMNTAINNFSTKAVAIKLAAVFTSLIVLAGAAQAQVSDTALAMFKTTKVGMHRISYEELRDDSLDLAGLKHNKFALVSDGESVAIRTKGQDKLAGPTSRFGPGGFIEFYAEDAEDLYNQARGIVLVYDRTQRKTIGKLKAKPDTGPSNSDYTHSETVEQDSYYDYLSPSKTDPWHFGQQFLTPFFSSPATTTNIEVVDLVGSNAELEINVYGIVDVDTDVDDHNMGISINGSEVGEESFDGNVSHTFSLANVPVNNGANSFALNLKPITETPFDAIGLNKVTVRYQRSAAIETAKGQLQGVFKAGQAEVAGITTPATVYRKDADGLTRLTRTNSDVANGTVRFATQEEADYVVVNDYHNVVVQLLPELDDIRSGDAEYLILTHANFQGAALQTLVQLRSVDYSVKVVDVAQVYAQFGDTLPSADAIAEYIKYAAANMGTRFVTLVGSDTLDYKNIGGTNSKSFIPTQYAETPGGFLFVRQTPSDASYGDLDADGVPDIAVGRLSVRTQAELAIVVEKIQDYQARSGYSGLILIAADGEDNGNGISFSDDANAIIDAIPLADWKGAVRPEYKALPDTDGAQGARDKIQSAINNGVSVAAYIGHSSRRQWSRTSPALLTTLDIAGLTNIDKPALVTQWGCWNTYFVDPAGNSMGDLMLVSGEQGAVTVLGASTLTSSEGERALGIELTKRMYLEGKPIGEAIIEAKQAFAQDHPDAADILLGWQIIGDPALVVNPE